MHRIFRPASVLAIGLLLGCLGPAATADAEPNNTDERKAQVLSNLQLQFPQLAELAPDMGDFTATDFDGLDHGSFTVRGQTQQFLIASDNSSLYMIAGDPIDVSKTSEEIEMAMQEKAAEEAKAAEERVAELAAAVEGEPYRGASDAPVTIVEFSDFQCPFCTRGAATMEQVLEKYEGKVKFVFKHFPLGFHPWARPAAIAAECAANQDAKAFWMLHDKYFEEQKALTPENVMEKSREFLGDSINIATWTACAEDTDTEEYKAAASSVDADMALGQKLGVSGTPGFFVNGQFLNGAQPLEAFEPLIAEAMKSDA